LAILLGSFRVFRAYRLYELVGYPSSKAEPLLNGQWTPKAANEHD
jgi:hypothetical protein